LTRTPSEGAGESPRPRSEPIGWGSFDPD
jgi:hypothetical protein